MEINLNNIHVPDAPTSAGETVAQSPVAEAATTAPDLQVSANALGASAPIPGEEAVGDEALRRDDDLGQLVERAYSVATGAQALPPLDFLPTLDAGEQVAKNIGDSAQKLKELFVRNQKAAEVEKDRLEAVLTAEAARAATDADRLDAMIREYQLQV